MVMIFVNELAEVRGLPWWTYHAHANQDVMTYVDMVFPFFLFIVGMAMPLSIEQRLKRNASLPVLWLHVFIRSASLIVLGLILANAEKVDSHRTGVSGALWGLCALIFACLYLNVYPKSQRLSRYAGILRAVGLIGVIVAFVIFRRTTPDGHAAWIDPGYPEILGLIGYTYLAAAVLYIPTRRWRWAAACVACAFARALCRDRGQGHRSTPLFRSGMCGPSAMERWCAWSWPASSRRRSSSACIQPTTTALRPGTRRLQRSLLHCSRWRPDGFPRR